MPQLKSNNSVIFAPNHFSWWDGFFIDWILKNETGYKIKMMMLEEQLKRYWFFNLLGAYSIDPKNFVSIKKTINYTRTLLIEKGNGIVIYPQGEIEPYEKRPLQFKEGLRLILKPLQDTIVIPVGFKIYYAEEKKPSILCRFGEPLPAETAVKNYSFFTEKFKNNLDLLDASVSELHFIKDYFVK